MIKKSIHYPTRYGNYNKYNAKKTEFMGYKFDSKWEAERYGQLSSMALADVVKDLQRQVKYDIIRNIIEVKGDLENISLRVDQICFDNSIIPFNVIHLPFF